MWKWHWTSKFVSPDHKVFLVTSAEGFDSIEEAEACFHVCCNEGYLVAQGIPAGSVSRDLQFVLQKEQE